MVLYEEVMTDPRFDAEKNTFAKQKVNSNALAVLIKGKKYNTFYSYHAVTAVRTLRYLKVPEP